MTGKWTLDTGSMQENFFSDSVLIGIVCTLPVHRFIWTINNSFDLNFIREPELDICLQNSKGNKTFFQIYQYQIPLSGDRYLMYKLKRGEEFLLQEVKQLDYLWFLQSNNAEEESKNIISQLRTIPDIQLAQIITSDRLKNLDNLLI